MPFVSSVRGNFGLQKKPFPISDGKISASSTGGTITTAGGYRIHTFTSVGSSTFTAVVSEFAGGNGSIRSNGVVNTGAGGTNVYAEYLLVGGGGGAQSLGGGAGGGGLTTGTAAITSGSNAVVVGGGGTAYTDYNRDPTSDMIGGNSTFAGVTGYGGGAGGRYDRNAASSSSYTIGGTGGGAGSVRSGGGGGAGAAGTPATNSGSGQYSGAPDNGLGQGDRKSVV